MKKEWKKLKTAVNMAAAMEVATFMSSYCLFSLQLSSMYSSPGGEGGIGRGRGDLCDRTKTGTKVQTPDI